MSSNRKSTPDSKVMHIVIPGYNSYQQSYRRDYSQSLQKFLNAAIRTAVADEYYDLVFSLFDKHNSRDDSNTVSVAALRQESPPINSGDFYMCADPVYMQADRDQLLMFDSQELKISDVEAQLIIESLNLHFKDDGLEFSVIDSARWVVRVDTLTEVVTFPLYRVVNRPLLDVMPQGNDGGKWKSIINEVQMLLHNHEVNDVREEQGLRAINGIWFWGEAISPVPSQVVSHKIAQVYTDEPWLVRLAELLKVPCRTIASIDKGAFKSPLNCIFGDSLYLDSRLSNEYGRLSIEQFEGWMRDNERDLWLPIKHKLCEGVFNQVNFYPGDGYCYKINHKSILQKLKQSPVALVSWIKNKLR